MRRGASSFIISLFAAQLLQATPEAAHKEAKQRKKNKSGKSARTRYDNTLVVERLPTSRATDNRARYVRA